MLNKLSLYFFDIIVIHKNYAYYFIDILQLKHKQQQGITYQTNNIR